MWCDVEMMCEMVCDVKSGGVMQHSDVEWYLVKCGDVVW